jgi:hypothetical protein
MRPFGVLLLLTLLATGLVGCGGTAPPPGSTNANYGQLDEQGNVITDRPESRAKPESTAPAKVAVIPFKPIPSKSLTGLSEKALVAKIGNPEMIRGEADIRVWQYRSDQCSFDVFFVPKAEGSERELRHMLARMRRGNQAISVQDCLDQIVKMNQARG